VHPDEVYVCTIDATGAIRARVRTLFLAFFSSFFSVSCLFLSANLNGFICCVIDCTALTNLSVVAILQLCRQSLQLIYQCYNEMLDSGFKMLKVKNNYMHSTDTIQPVAMPSKDAFYSLFQVSLTQNCPDS
jgi:hypothetical protein